MKYNLLPTFYSIILYFFIYILFSDMIFFFKAVTGTVIVTSYVPPQVFAARTTRSNSNRNFAHFISRKCDTVTFQRSFSNDRITNGLLMLWHSCMPN